MPRKAIPFQLTMLAIFVVFSACNKMEVSSNHIHPDIDKSISITGTVDDYDIEPVDIDIIVDEVVQSGQLGQDPPSKTAYPRLNENVHSNEKLPFSATAQNEGGGTYKDEDWIFVANPKGFPSGPASPSPSPRFPTKRREETGARLFHSTESVVIEHAIDAIQAYSDSLYARGVLEDVDCDDILANADYIVEAIAEYVSRNSADRDDYNLIDFHNFNVYDHFRPEGYRPYLTSSLGGEKDFPQPANLTLLVGAEVPPGFPTTTLDPADPIRFIIGDCEDKAIVRVALLRQLGFAPWAIWCVTDLWTKHEYNLVLYQGAYRIMANAPIDNYLESYEYKTFWGWNERFGPRGWGIWRLGTHFRLIHRVNNYPGGKGDRHIWCWTVYTTKVSP